MVVGLSVAPPLAGCAAALLLVSAMPNTKDLPPPVVEVVRCAGRLGARPRKEGTACGACMACTDDNEEDKSHFTAVRRRSQFVHECMLIADAKPT